MASREDATVDLMLSETIKTSAIEGEDLDRESVRSSLLSVDNIRSRKRVVEAWMQTFGWLERMYHFYQQNDYGVLNPLLPNAHLLLTRDQLK